MLAKLAGTRERFTFVVDGVDVDWLGVLLACSLSGRVTAGVAFAAVAIALRRLSSRTVAIEGEGDNVYVTVTRFWQRVRPENRAIVTEASLRHWHAYGCSGIVLRSSDLSLVASTRRASRLRLP